MVDMKKGDRLPILSVTVKDTAGNVVDISSATAKFTMANARSGVKKIDGLSATITDGTAGTIEYAWGTVDTNETGQFRGEFEITYTATQKKLTAPSEGYIEINIFEDLD